MKNGDFSKDAVVAASQNIKERDYWLDKLSGYVAKSSFSNDCEKPVIIGHPIDNIKFRFTGQLFSRLMKICNNSDYRLHILLVAVLDLLLYKYTENKDIIVGTSIYKQDVEGELLNTVLPLRNQVKEDMSCKQFLLEVAKTVFEADEHQNYPMETLLYKLNLSFTGNHFPLFDTAILMENIHDKNYLQHIKLNMLFTFMRAGDCVDGVLEYNPILYDKIFIKRLIRHFSHLLGEFVFNLDSRITGIDILSPEEKKKIIFDFNNNKSGFSRDKSIFQLFENQVENNPDRISTAIEEQQLAYRQLNERANQLARYLRGLGVRGDQLVGILLNRSLDMAIGILAAWKAGGAYIPIDPGYPLERIKYILEDSRALIVLTDTETIKEKSFTAFQDLKSGTTRPYLTAPCPHSRILLLDELQYVLPGKSSENLIPVNQMRDLAYVIYTSGSTGKPKGAMIEHMGMMNHIQAKINDLRITGKSCVAQNASHTFDISVWQFFTALAVGGKTIIYPNQLILEPNRFITQLLNHQVTILEVVPSYLSVILDVLEDGNVHLPLEFLLVTGETLKPQLVKKWFEQYPHIPMVNAYGPTEASDDITHYIIAKVSDRERIPIGKPVQNLNIYIVDQNMNLSPPGVKGEICVSGVGVGRGYLNDGEKTSCVFIEDPFLKEKGVRFYKTGDLARWLPDGTIDFFGRKDYQVKIRGFRIELAEIENHLVQHVDVKEAVVIDREDEAGGQRYLCAYMIPQNIPNIPDIKTYLSKRLPGHMVPTHYEVLDALPLTPNGKIDRSQLPAPSLAHQSPISYITWEKLEELAADVEKNLTHKITINKKNELIEDPGPGEGKLSSEEREQLLKTFNDTAVEYPADKTIHELFEEQVRRTPGTVSVVADNQHISYRELNRRATNLGRILRNRGAKPGDVIGLMLERSIQMMVGILAILKSGAAYSPIGSEYPAERVKFMLEDSEALLLLTDDHEKAPGYKSQFIDIHQVDIDKAEGANLPFINKSTDLMYVIYTSGTTGIPKGVMIEHRSMVNFIKGMTDIFDFTGKDCILSLITISFDIFALEAFIPLIRGFRLVVGGRDAQMQSDAAAALIERENVTIFQATPSLVRMFLESSETTGSLASLRYLLIGGEVFPGELRERLNRVTKARIYNMYGPTETTIWSTVKDVTGKKGLNIGKPIANTQIYILSKRDVLLPLGVVGELCIGGAGVARGYLKREALTAEKFIPNPFREHERLYKTGDLARWLPDGNLEFLGRIDHQVQFNGIRVEPGEIENILLNYPGIKEAAVVVRRKSFADPGEIQKETIFLYAFVVTDRSVTERECREYLVRELPPYMLPSHFIQLEKMPLTPSGKVDRKMLGRIRIETTTRGEFQVPLDEVEEKLAGVWSEILGVPREGVSTNANFFDLGGHSLKAMNMIAKTHKVLNVKLPLDELFKNPTIKGLARYIKKSSADKYFSIESVEKKEYYSLSSTQGRMYIVHQVEKGSTSYNSPSIVRLNGILDRERLQHTFRELTRRNESLRTSFIMLEHGPVQRVHQAHQLVFEIQYYQVEVEGEVENIVENFIRPFELSKAPLMKVRLIKTGEAGHVLMVDMHHIISDGYSFGILVKDFMALYNGEELPPLRIQYKDFSQWQNRLHQSGGLKKQEEYWLNIFAGDIPVLEMPQDYPRPAVRNIDDGDHINETLGNDLTGKLGDVVKKTDSTLFVVLLAVYNILLFKYTGQEDFVVGSPVTGRSHGDLESIVGVFLNMLSMRNRPQPHKSVKDFIKEVKENTFQALDNQDYPFEELVKKLGLQGETSRNPLFDTEFAVNNIDIEEIVIPGLKMEEYHHGPEFAKFDLHFLATEKNDGTIELQLRYYTALFSKLSAEKIMQHFIETVKQVVDNLDMKLEDIAVCIDLLTVKSKIVEEEQGDFQF